MKVCHNVVPVFDDANLVGCGGLPAVMMLAERAGLHELVAAHVWVPGTAGANASVKVAGIIAGMVAGADSISDLDLLRHGGMGRVFDRLRAPTTLGTHLRGYSFGHVRQLDAVASRLLAGLARCSPVLAGGQQVVFVDVDDTIRETHGHAKQGADYAYSGVEGLNAQIAVASTPVAAPVVTAARLRKGTIDSGHGAARLITDSLATLTRAVGTTPELVIVRADSAYYRHDVIAAATAGGARFSVTARMNPAVRRAIANIQETAWTLIRYPEAVYDTAQQGWISDAEVAEVAFTAFTSRPKTEQVTGRLIVRRVKRLNPEAAPSQGELLPGYRYHAVFTNNPMPLVEAEACHRDHAIIEAVFADLKGGALAHAPSGVFTANAAWLAMAVMAFNLTRAAGRLASPALGRARTFTVRHALVNVAARIANQARRWWLHLPRNWPWHDQLHQLYTHSLAPPKTVAS